MNDTETAGGTRRCFTCGAEVARRHIRKNRYGERICRDCRRAGVLFSRGRRTRRWLKSLVRPVMLLLMWVGIALVIAKLVAVVLGGSTNESPPQ